MSQINSGEYEDSILEELSRQGSNVGEQDLATFMTLYRTLMQKPEKSELVIRPTDLKLE